MPAAKDSAFTKFSRKLKWAFVTMLAPEFVLMLDVGDQLAAERLMLRLREPKNNRKLEGIMAEVEVADSSSRPAQHLKTAPKHPNLFSSIRLRFKRAHLNKDKP